MKKIGSIINLSYYLFSLFCFSVSTYYLLNFFDLVELFTYWAFGRFLFQLGFLLSIKIYAQKIVKDLSKVSGFKEKIKVMVIDIPLINAFAFKKGGTLGLGIFGKTERVIALTTELIKLTTKDELNFVIAHEFAHHYKNHLLLGFISQVASRVSLTVLASKPFSKTALLSAVTLAASNILLRKQEREADLLGAQFLQKAGYSCHGGITFLKKLSKFTETDETKVGKLIDFFISDHPGIKERIKNLELNCKDSER